MMILNSSRGDPLLEEAARGAFSIAVDYIEAD